MCFFLSDKGFLERDLVYLPLYIGFYVYESKEYSVAINGLSGSVTGERPYGLGSTVDVAKAVGQKGWQVVENWRKS